MHSLSNCSFRPFQHIVRDLRSSATLLILTPTGNGAKFSSMLAAAELSWRTQFRASTYLIDGSGIEKQQRMEER
jgi:hypothetical protein